MKVLFHKHSIAETVAGLALCIALFSCTGKEFIDREDDCRITAESDKICFGVTGIEGKLTKAGSAAGNAECKYPSGQFVMRSTDTDDTLCVTVEMSEGIAASSGSGAMTRSAPVTSIDEYGNFRVQALYRKEETPSSITFYMDDTVEDFGNGTWGTVNSTYYWPGAGRTLQFYAWAPAAPAEPAESGMTEPNSVEKMVLEYEVPESAVDQKDIIVAVTGEVTGDYNNAVPLEFKHVCTAVRFVAGDVLQPGAIKSVSLKNVKCSGSYDMTMTADAWALNGEVADFSQTFTAQETNTGDEIVTGENTFMMLPQTLPDGAVVEVVFQNRGETETRTLQASIAGTEWPMGMTVTYKLSITPEYEFKLSDERTLDAHYEIYKTNLVVLGVPSGQSWTISAPDNVTIQAQSDMNSWAQQGYWTDRNINERGNDNGSARGNSSYTGTGSGDFPIVIFVPENVGDEKRSIALSIAVNGSAVQTINIDQYAPSWYGSNIGCERMEGDPQPWGFYWSNDYAITFDLTSCNENDRESLRQYVEWTQGLHALSENLLLGWLIRLIFGDDIPDLSFIDMEKSNTEWWGGGITDKITINIGSLNTENIAESTDNGQQNTRDIYNFQGIQLVNEIINRIQNVRGYDSSMMTETGTGVFPTNNAAITCMKLNSWNIATVQDEEILQLSNNSPTPDWYLPASGEITGINDAEHPLNGNYWTSTSVQNSHENAYKYDAGGTISSERRDTKLNVRAVRKR